MVKTKKKSKIFEYGNRKYLVEFDHFYKTFELYGFTHDDNLFLINNEDKVRREVKDRYEKEQ